MALDCKEIREHIATMTGSDCENDADGMGCRWCREHIVALLAEVERLSASSPQDTNRQITQKVCGAEGRYERLTCGRDAGHPGQHYDRALSVPWEPERSDGRISDMSAGDQEAAHSAMERFTAMDRCRRVWGGC